MSAAERLRTKIKVTMHMRGGRKLGFTCDGISQQFDGDGQMITLWVRRRGETHQFSAICGAVEAITSKRVRRWPWE